MAKTIVALYDDFDVAQDVLEELQISPLAPSLPSGDQTQSPPEAARLLTALGFDPVSPEELAARCEFDMAQIQAHLLTLELNGMIETLPGGKVCRLATP